jgi:hypothetical protein
MPSNYAWSPVDGYKGLILHHISPWLAERVFPYIATNTAEAFVGAMLGFGGAFSSLPMLNSSLPVRWTLASFIMYVPAIHRVALVDVRVLRLLLREFETLYLFCSMILATAVSVSPLFPSRYVHLYGVNNGLAAGQFQTRLGTPEWSLRRCVVPVR